MAEGQGSRRQGVRALPLTAAAAVAVGAEAGRGIKSAQRPGGSQGGRGELSQYAHLLSLVGPSTQKKEGKKAAGEKKEGKRAGKKKEGKAAGEEGGVRGVRGAAAGGGSRAPERAATVPGAQDAAADGGGSSPAAGRRKRKVVPPAAASPAGAAAAAVAGAAAAAAEGEEAAGAAARPKRAKLSTAVNLLPPATLAAAAAAPARRPAGGASAAVCADLACFPPLVQSYMAAEGFAEPTPIQAQAWPLLLGGRDLEAVAGGRRRRLRRLSVPPVLPLRPLL